MVVLSTQVSSSLVLVACIHANMCFTDSKGYNIILIADTKLFCVLLRYIDLCSITLSAYVNLLPFFISAVCHNTALLSKSIEHSYWKICTQPQDFK